MAGSLLTSVRVVQGMLKISGQTLVDSVRGSLTRELCDERLAWWGSEVARHADIRLTVEGKERLASREPFIVMSNHQSHFDIPVLFHAVSPSIRMVTKTELFRIPVWGGAMRKSGFIEIDRKNRESAIRSLEVAKERLADGVNVWIAPEGTRSRNGTMLPFKKGGFVLALDTATRILPIGIAGTRDILPADHLASRSGQRVAVIVGEPIDVVGKDRDVLMAETRTKLESLVARAEALRS
jgi:1-acyl-sn-glycerol-3-phosphate acyltransferase